MDPSNQPSVSPSRQPSRQPMSKPTYTPSLQPSACPSRTPTDFPTMQPSSYPSRQPFNQPTSQPTLQPTNLPTAQPSGHPSPQPSQCPSRIPSALPSSLPTVQPIAAPSAQPTRTPTRQPSRKPSRRPVAQPTCQPSEQPTQQPLAQPTTQPSRRPTEAPSENPTRYPSHRPTGQPQATPSLQPSVKPSRQPGSSPTSQPTELPTLQPSVPPTSVPTSQPRASPSRKPSGHPTKQPVGTPSSRPSRHPTLHPSAQPYVEPTVQPSLTPTSTPSETPTRLPVEPTWAPVVKPTHAPSVKNIGGLQDTLTGYPTSQPSLSERGIWALQGRAVLENIRSRYDTSNTLFFEDVVFDGAEVSWGGSACAAWNRFYSALTVASMQKRVERISIYVIKSVDTLATTMTPARSCQSGEDVAAILQGMIASYESYFPPANFSCRSSPTTSSSQVASGNNTSSLWTVGSCGSFPAVEIDGEQLFSPCLSQCARFRRVPPMNAIRVLAVTFKNPKPAPSIRRIYARPSRTSIELTVELGADGYVNCAALTQRPYSVRQITAKNFGAWTSLNSSTVTLTTLDPFTPYFVYCTTLSADGVQGTLTAALSSAVNVTTTCCKSVTITLASKGIVADQMISSYLQIQLDSPPGDSLLLSPSIGGYIDSSAALFLPLNVQFSTRNYMPQTVAFAGSLPIGYYNLTLAALGPSAHEYEIVYSGIPTIRVLDSHQEPVIPRLSGAEFSSDGSYVLLKFDTSTDRGGSSYGLSSFLCSSLVSIPASTGAMCQWSADAKSINIFSGSSRSVLDIGDAVSVLPRTIKADCTPGADCDAWAFVEAASVVIARPRNPVTPAVSISSPNSISACDAWTIDLSASSGSGGQPWANVTFHISSGAPNASAVEDYLNSQYSFSPPTAVSHTLLSKGYMYRATVILCNFLGSCGTSSVTVAVLNVIQPTVSIIGSQLQTISRASSLSLSALAYTSDCTGTTSTQFLQYTWGIADDSGMRDTAVSISKDPSKFLLAPYALQTTKTFVVTLTVTQTQSLKSSTASIQVYMQSSPLAAVIAGGSVRSIRILSTVSIDATSSYDPDQPDYGGSGIAYAWTCSQTRPIFNSVCALSFDAKAFSSSVLKGSADIQSANSSSIVSLKISRDVRVAMASITVSVISASAPFVAIVTAIPTTVNINSQLSLSGTAEFLGYAVLSWTVSDLTMDLSAMALTPTTIQSMSTSNTSATASILLLPANSLPQRSTLSFTLTCTVAGLTSSSSIQIVTNGPPLPGSFSVTPTSGTELQDDFTFVATAWTSRDLPIEYEFGFVAVGYLYLVVKAKSQSSFGSSHLPAGISSDAFQVKCTMQAFDSLGSNASLSLFVTVNPMPPNQTALQQLVQSQLSLSSGSVDLTKQVISTVSSVLNAVNCSASPNCTSLHRLPCSTSPHTCGPCMPGGLYLGTEGSSNDACVSVLYLGSKGSSSSKSVTTACTTSQDCMPWGSCSSDTHTCVVPPKTCVNDCSGHGSCTYQLESTGATLSSCLADDSRCVATCVCSNGYSGNDCSVTPAQLTAKQLMRNQLIAKLYGVTLSENANPQIVTSWSNTIGSLSQNPSELTLYSGQLGLQIISGVVAASSSLGCSGVLSSMASAIDYLSQVRRTTSNSSSSRTLAAGDPYIDGVKSAVASMGQLTMLGMVKGQRAVQVAQPSYRAATQIISAVGSVSRIAVPLTALELASGMQSSSVSVAPQGRLTVGLNVVTLSPRVFSSAIPSNSSLRSLPVEVQGKLATLCGTQPQPIYYKLQHTIGTSSSSPLPATFAQQPSVTNLTTYCTKGLISTATYACPTSQNITVHCDGSNTQLVVSQCPENIYTPSCHILSSSIRNRHIVCSIVNETATYTTCACSICNASSPTGKPRRLATASRSSPSSSSSSATAASVSQLATNEALQVATIGSYTLSAFNSVISTITDFNSEASLKASMLVSISFAVLWLGSCVLLAILDRERKPRKAKKGSSNAVTVQPAAAAAASTSSTTIAVTTAEENISEGDIGTAAQQLRAYISSFFPSVFDNKPRSSRLWHEIMYNHKYFAVLLRERGFRKWVGGFELLTNLTANMFLLAVFYNVQWPSDDGSCRIRLTEADCVAGRSPFDHKRHICAWTQSTHAATTTAGAVSVSMVCVWVRPTFDPSVLIIISMIVILFTVPIHALLKSIFTVLYAPLASELEVFSNHQKRNPSVHEKLGVGHPAAGSAEIAGDSPDVEEIGVVKNRRAFATAVSVKAALGENQQRAHRMSTKLCSLKAASSATGLRFNDFEIFLSELMKHRASLSRRERTHFEALWGLEGQTGQERDRGGVGTSDEWTAELRRDFQSVLSEAADVTARLKLLPASHAGVEILQHFATDIIGRQSRRAKIFENQLRSFDKKLYVTWGFKCLVASCLLCINMFFIFVCMLYGKQQGLQWQRGWLIASSVNFVVEVFMKEVSEFSCVFILFFLLGIVLLLKDEWRIITFFCFINPLTC